MNSFTVTVLILAGLAWPYFGEGSISRNLRGIRMGSSSSSGTSESGEDGEEEEELQSNDPSTIAFYLYPNPENQSYLEELRLGEPDSIAASSYSRHKTPVLLIHGFTNNYTCRFSQRVKNALLEAGLGSKHNVIVVDWGLMSTPNTTDLGAKPLNDLAKNPLYKKAVNNVPVVGKRISEFIGFLMAENYLDSPSSVYLIGFSLGAQVSGCAGYEVQQNMSMEIGRITGIDPAGPLFNSQPNLALKLDASDAEFIKGEKLIIYKKHAWSVCRVERSGVNQKVCLHEDKLSVVTCFMDGPLNSICEASSNDCFNFYCSDVVHTNQGQSGYEGNIGDLDFYPNGGGPNQNDCVGGGVVDNVSGSCAHNRAWVYYIKALQTEVYACKCYATPDYVCKIACQSKILFGYYTPRNATGVYYVDIFVKE